ncbi:MAG: protein kinase [Clostridia bacterium]|nr:protein kinase [Clostridia bacterium]
MESRLIGKIVSRRFRVEEVIGRGGMAIVYRAFDLKEHQTVALKVLREEYENDPEYQERFKREAEVCGRLNHPNVVNMIDSGKVSGVCYIAIEYVDGETLKELITRSGQIEQEQAVRYALQILAALAHAHQRGVVHRDVKPQNVLVSRTGQLKISDFGIAGVADSKTLTTDGNVMGSVHYFSPEQAKGMKATAASDLYSVGVILYEMLTGHVPFEGETAVSVAMMHLMEEPKPVREEADVCRAVELIVRKSLEKQPQNRYQSADAMMRDLRRALRHPDGAFIQQQKRRVEEGARQPARVKRALRGPSSVAGKLATAFVVLLFIALIAVAGLRLYRSMFIVSSVPDLAGLDEGTATRMVEAAGLRAQVFYAYSSTPEGYVDAQAPAAREEAARGETVTITISRGSGMLAVPRLSGMTEESALDAISAQGFTVGKTEIVPSEQMRGTVVAQSPEAGTSAQVGSAVDLTVSGGRVIVPELVGQREEEALERIEALGLTRGMIEYSNVDSARQDGIVLSQSLEKFTQVLPGSEIEMVVGFYDKRKYTASVSLTVVVPAEGVSVRVTLVGEDGRESDMYAATLTEPGKTEISVLLRSEQSGVMTWRLYLDGGFKSEATAVLQ